MNLRKTAVATAVATALAAPYHVLAQDNDEIRDLEEIVVTGTASNNITKLESSVAVTTISSEELAILAPQGLAETMEMIPGLWVEPSGGEVGNNVAPRGLQGVAATSFLATTQDGVIVAYDSSFSPDQVMRPDLTVERIEAIRGGSSGIFSPNGAGGTVNYITRKGTETPEGQVRLTVSDYGTFRPEFVYTGPLSDDWLVAVGGYYRVSDGIRDVGYTADKGGQLSLVLTRKLSNGRLHLGVKSISEDNIFHTPTILNNPNDPDNLPGLDGARGSIVGPDLVRHQSIVPGREDTDLRTGFDNDSTIFTADFLWDFDNNWSVSNKSRYTDHKDGNKGLFTQAPLDATAFVNGTSSFGGLAGFDGTAGLDGNDVVALYGGTAALRYSGTGEIIAPGDLATLNGNGLIGRSEYGYFPNTYQEFTNDLRFTHSTERNTFAAGLLVNQVDSSIRIYNDTRLNDVRNQAQRVDLVAIDAAGAVLGSFTDNGVAQYGSWYADTNSESTSYSFYLNNEFQVTDDFRVDAGVRFESYDQVQLNVNNSGQTFLQDAVDDAGNDLDNVYANNFYQGGPSSGTTSTVYDTNETAWTVGFNYKMNDNVAFYGRFADGFQTPPIDAIGNGIQEMTFAELGIRYQGQNLSASATLFRTEFDTLNVFGQVGAGGQPQAFKGGSFSNGVELEGIWDFGEFFTLNLVGVLQGAELDGFPSNFIPQLNGNQIVRAPDEQLRVSPTVHINDNIDVFATVHWVGERAANPANTQIFPDYTSIDLGVAALLNDNLSLVVRGNNLTDELGLTEGNPRAGLGGPVSDVFVGRPILGRSVVASITYSFGE